VCASLIWPSFLQGNLNRPAAFTRIAAEYLRRPGAATDQAPDPQLIYISRSSYPSRRMANEAELVTALTELGFSVVRPEELTVERQIRLFSNARLVIGEVGAALANLLFAPAACKVIEIVPETKPGLWIKRWCGLRGMEWYCVYTAVPAEARQVSVVDGVKYNNLYFTYTVNVKDVVNAARHALRA
jgi:capsular polysaccharide biosynthesis protein